MQLWQDGLLAMLAAIGLASLMWAAVRTVLFSGPERRPRAVVIVPAAGDGADLEGQVRKLGLLRQEQGAFGRVLLLDCGLNETGQRAAALLAESDRWVAVCRQEDIFQYLQ